MSNESIIRLDLVDGKIEVIRRIKSNSVYGNGTPVPDGIYKDIYGVKDGELFLLETIKGKHIPTKVIHESFEF